MTANASPHTKEEAIAKALAYLDYNDLGIGMDIHEVFYRETINDEETKEMETLLGRVLDDDELRLMQLHNKSGWVVQFVSEPCPKGATPQGPKVLVNDDGQISHFRPM